jgi:hypothetical protein
VLNAENRFVPAVGELKSRSLDGGRCGTAIRNFVMLYCGCERVFLFQTSEHSGFSCMMREWMFEFRDEQNMRYADYTHWSRRHVHKPGFNIFLIVSSQFILK